MDISLNTANHVVSRGPAPNIFDIFLKFPAEIRTKIWEASLANPRIVEILPRYRDEADVEWYEEAEYFVTALPAQFHVNVESRQVAARYYQKASNINNFSYLGPQIFFNFDLDTAFFPRDFDLFSHLWGCSFWKSNIAQHFRRVAFSLGFLHSFEYDHLLCYLESLEELVFVAFEPASGSSISYFDAVPGPVYPRGPAQTYSRLIQPDANIQQLWAEHGKEYVDLTRGTDQSMSLKPWDYHSRELRDELNREMPGDRPIRVVHAGVEKQLAGDSIMFSDQARHLPISTRLKMQ